MGIENEESALITGSLLSSEGGNFALNPKSEFQKLGAVPKRDSTLPIFNVSATEAVSSKFRGAIYLAPT
ncbi:hypothetical protein TrRE_jg11390 [Triparma retinervis]|uniref:Uncharacterized protein n=1 Tax=Triparma retinervis TaxID=2557542 RepID=A0A9W7CA66_9STRA|nr:hypothetical protein TrRE_jg11390 [Triparma retinervis]